MAVNHNKPKMLKALVYKVIDREFFAQFTWTGKSTGGRTKTAVQKFINLNDFFYEVMNVIDGGYTQFSFLRHYKNNVIKGAYVHE